MPEPHADPAGCLLFPAARPELCLDFANTCCWRGTSAPEESLRSPADLLGWAAQTASIPPALVEQLSVAGEVEQAHLFDAAIALREAMFRIFSAVATGDAPAAPDIGLLNAGLSGAPSRGALAQDQGRFAWSCESGGRDAAATLLAPVLWSAADLLVQGDAHRIRRCANEKCLWLFIDRSKAGTRRWCDMGACGNRAKSQRHYARTKGG